MEIDNFGRKFVLFFNCRSHELFGLRVVVETAFVFSVISLYLLSYMHNRYAYHWKAFNE